MRVLKMELDNCFCFKNNTIPPIGEFGMVNCFIGENDRGKSLALKILDMAFNSYNSSVFEGIRTASGDYNVSLNPIGRKLIYGDSNSMSKITIYLEIDDTKKFKEILYNLQSKFSEFYSYRNIKLEYKIEFTKEEEGRFWLDRVYFGLEKNNEWINMEDFGDLNNSFRQILYNMMSQNGFLLIPAIRLINREIIQGVDLGWSPKPDGTGLANAVFEYKNNPRLGKRGLIKQVNNDVEKLTEFSTVSALTDQNQRDVEYDEIPKSFVGDASKQITVAVFDIRSSSNKKIIGFEEPESHLHPGKQKKYLAHLLDLCDKNKTQLFVTTHSPFLINMFDMKDIYHFKRDKDKNIQIECCTSDEDLWLLLSEIGVKPSDFLQSDLLIFTEGPSDTKILEIFADKIGYDLRKYNVCLIHLGSINEDLDLESLLRVNMNYKLIIDSNIGNPRGEKATKKIKTLFETVGQIDRLKIWSKRAIENYLSSRAIEEYYNLLKDAIRIEPNTNVVAEIEEKSSKKGVTVKYSKTKDGPKIASLMNENEIDKEIHEFFKEIIKNLQSRSK